MKYDPDHMPRQPTCQAQKAVPEALASDTAFCITDYR